MDLKTKFIKIIFSLLVIAPLFSLAQEFDEFEQEEEMAKETKVITISPKIGQWKTMDYGAFQDSIKLDTLIDNFHNYNPVFKNSITSSYVGNLGTPALNNDFFSRITNLDYFFLRSREVYLLTPDSIVFYNTRTPYTRLDFSQSENKTVKNETRFNVFHSQNATPYLNFTLRLDMAKSLGQYNAQESKNNFITLYSSYNKENIQLYSGIISNVIANNENGGLSDDNLIFNGAESQFLNTNLGESQSLFKSTFYFVNGEYRFGKMVETEDESDKFRPIFGVLYNGIYQRHKHEFIDEESEDNTFFANTYYGNDYFKDSIRFNKISNVFQLKQYENANRKISFGKRAFIGQEFVATSFPGITLATQQIRTDDNFSNVYVGGGIFRETGKFWNWNFKGKIYLLGRNLGQTELSGVISKPFTILKDTLASLKITGTIENRVPDYFQEKYYSNHFQWNNNFSMEQRMVAGGSFTSPKHHLKVSANYALINNFIYNNEEGIPAQTGTELLILSAFIDKDFNYRGLHFRTRVLWQKASNETFIHLPDLSAFISGYYKFVISKVLFTQIGFDTRYNTKYYADAYSPATGLFYLQNKKKYGNYPYIDFFANLRLKRTTVFFKMINAGTNFLDGEYFTTPNYPMPRSSIRFGVSWLFYN